MYYFILQQSSNQVEIEDLRSKLQTAEQTIEKMRKRITVMDHVSLHEGILSALITLHTRYTKFYKKAPSLVCCHQRFL